MGTPYGLWITAPKRARTPARRPSLVAAVVLAAACASTTRAEGSRAFADGQNTAAARQELTALSSRVPGKVDHGMAASVRPTAEEIAGGLLWRFHAGAPLPGAPAVAADGHVYAAGTDGYVHALDADGAFRWSYTVTGRVVGAPDMDAAGRLYLATAAHRVYALTASGHKWWVFNAPASPTSGVAATSEGAVYFEGSDGFLWALSPRAIVVFRAKLAGALIGHPVVTRQSVVVGTSSGVLSVIRSATVRWDVALGQSIAAEPLVDGGNVYPITGTKLVALKIDDSVPRWTRENITFVAAAGTGRLVVTSSDGGVMFLSATDGKEISKYDVGRASAPPVVDENDAFVPCDDGVVRVVDVDHGVIAAIAVARAPLLKPSVSREIVVVGAGDGTIAGIDASRWKHRGP